MAHVQCPKCSGSRREFLRTGLYGLGVGTSLPVIFSHTSLSIAAEAFQTGRESHPERILVVVELSGGNDGLDTVIPWRDDNYRKVRPSLAASGRAVIRANDDYGFHPSLGGFKKVWENGQASIIHGCGYPNPDRSHFTSMEYWHTAMPHQAETLGWVGRLADAQWPDGRANTIVNITQKQSLAVQARLHAPVVFNNPEEFVRAGDALQADSYRKLIDNAATGNATLDFLSAISRTASESSRKVREAVRDYRTPVAYGSTSLALDLRKVAALIQAGFPTRIYYVSLGGFDTHASQAAGRFYLLTGLGEGLRAFLEDVKRIGRANDVAIMMFSEFGRRVEENASAGTDHGTAGPMFVLGAKVKPGFVGQHPSLTDLDGNGDLKMTTDFRRVYATMIDKWMGYQDVKPILRGDFRPLELFS
ncbi:MAG: DUF1501 domain-containing protein [Acidobacteria bacterium]|nr:DUF1501 domain-containing protein [Acidobacteriota bacterium]